MGRTVCLVSDGEHEWEVTPAEWFALGTEQGWTVFDGPEFSGRRITPEQHASSTATPEQRQ